MGVLSLEALAMADMNHLSFDLDVDEWERRDQMDSPPPHLVAEDEEDQVRKYKKEKEQEAPQEENDDDRALKKKKKKKTDVDGSDMRRCLIIWVNKVMTDAKKV
ncbi:hypothetical protein L484_022138 [Morus notabilis]|uniref:Uncharacterized protein n=1 Tax=Morus notabilis TaxID=981085 RepID=W9QDP8_9ROSA|nr:hypothetical protein L484_022138 [Morus notabilis]